MKRPERLLVLAASWLQIPCIEYAKDAGYEVITCDNRPDNAGHKLAHKSFNISTVDRNAVLAKARELKVDGVLAYGTDVAALTVAHVAESLGLPTHPYHAIETLTEKHLFRKHLEQGGFNLPAFHSAADPERLKTGADDLSLPVVVKPVDSSGSKGVAKVDDFSELGVVVDAALDHSRQSRVIVEEFIEKKGYQLTGDGFLIDGELVFRAFTNQHFAPGGDPCQPTGESLPAAFDEQTLDRIHAETQRLMQGLGMGTGAVNFDVIVDKDDQIYFLEIGPRCGGNRLPTLIHHATGVDLTAAAVEAALGHPVELKTRAVTTPHASYNLTDYLTAYGMRDDPEHRPISLVIKKTLLPRIIFFHMELASGEMIQLNQDADTTTRPFHPDELSVGFLLMRFDDPAEMIQVMDEIDRYVQIV